MSDMPKKFTFEIRGNLNSAHLKAIKTLFNKSFSEKVEIITDDLDVSRHILSIPEVSVASGIIGALAGLASFCIMLYEKHQRTQKENKWDKQRLDQLLEDAMLKYDVYSFAVEKIDNFDSLLGKSNNPCVALINETNTGNQYTVYILRSGSTYVFQVS